MSEFLINGYKNKCRLIDAFSTLQQARQFIETHRTEEFTFINIIEYKYQFRTIYNIEE